MKGFFANALLLLLSIIASFAIADALLHIGRWHLRYVSPQAPQGYFRYDPELGFDITPNFATSTHEFTDIGYPIWSNSLGCFDYQYDGRSPYIYAGGDSMAWGFAPLQDKWGKVLEQGFGIRTLTCGENGYGTRQEIIKARRVLEVVGHAPEVMVISYYENDPADDANFPNYNVVDGYVVWGNAGCSTKQKLAISPLEATTTCNVPPMKYSGLQQLKFQLGVHSVLYSLFTQVYANKLKSALLPYNAHLQWLHPLFPWFIPSAAEILPQEDTSSDTQTEDLGRHFHERNLKYFKELADAHHTKLLFVLIPNYRNLGATSTDPSWNNSKISEFLEANDIAHLDLWQEFHNRTGDSLRTFYWPINDHMNIAGNHLTGLLTAKYLLEHDMLRVDNGVAMLADINAELAEKFPVIPRK